MKNLKIFSLLSFILIFVASCTTNAQSNKKESTDQQNTGEIISVAVNHTVGRGGFSNLSATSNSFEVKSAGGIMAPKYPSLKKTITATQWKNLISGLNISTLSSLASGEPTSHYDGPEDTYTIVTKSKTITIVNPDPKKGKQLIDLQTKLEALRQAK